MPQPSRRLSAWRLTRRHVADKSFLKGLGKRRHGCGTPGRALNGAEWDGGPVQSAITAGCVK